jgi:hypothetical protein
MAIQGIGMSSNSGAFGVGITGPVADSGQPIGVGYPGIEEPEERGRSYVVYVFLLLMMASFMFVVVGVVGLIWWQSQQEETTKTALTDDMEMPAPMPMPDVVPEPLPAPVVVPKPVTPKPVVPRPPPKPKPPPVARGPQTTTIKLVGDEVGVSYADLNCDGSRDRPKFVGGVLSFQLEAGKSCTFKLKGGGAPPPSRTITAGATVTCSKSVGGVICK